MADVDTFRDALVSEHTGTNGEAFNRFGYTENVRNMIFDFENNAIKKKEDHPIEEYLSDNDFVEENKSQLYRFSKEVLPLTIEHFYGTRGAYPEWAFGINFRQDEPFGNLPLGYFFKYTDLHPPHQKRVSLDLGDQMDKYLYSERFDGMAVVWTGAEIYSRNGANLYEQLPEQMYDFLWENFEGKTLVGTMIVLSDSEPDGKKFNRYQITTKDPEICRRLRFCVYDDASVEFRHHPYETRYKNLGSEFDNAGENDGTVELVKQFEIETEENFTEKVAEMFLRGSRGVVLTRKDATYNELYNEKKRESVRVKPKVWTDLVKHEDETDPESTATAANVQIDKAFFVKKKKDGSTTPTESLTVEIKLRKESRRLGEMTHAFVSPGDFKYKKSDTVRDYKAFVEYSRLPNQQSELVPLEKCVLPESVGKELKQMYNAIKSDYVLSSRFVKVQLARLGYKFDFEYSYYFPDEIQSGKICSSLVEDSKNERQKKLYLNEIYKKGDEKWIVQYYKKVNESVDFTFDDDIEDGYDNGESEPSKDDGSSVTDDVESESDKGSFKASDDDGSSVTDDVENESDKGSFKASDDDGSSVVNDAEGESESDESQASDDDGSSVVNDAEGESESDESQASDNNGSSVASTIEDESDNGGSGASGEGNLVENNVYLVSTYFGKGYFRFPAKIYPSHKRTYSVEVDEQVATVTGKDEEATDKEIISLLIRIERDHYEYVDNIGEGIKIPSENQVFLKNGPKQMERVYNTFFEPGRPQRAAKGRRTTKERFKEKIDAHFATFFRNGIIILPEGQKRDQGLTEKKVIFVCLYYYARHNQLKFAPFFRAVYKMFVKGGHPIADAEEKKFISEIRSIR
jgi:hypothetical protein